MGWTIHFALFGMIYVKMIGIYLKYSFHDTNEEVKEKQNK